MKFLLFAILLLTPSCRTDSAPPIDLCIGNGTGGCDGTRSTGEHFSMSPSQLNHAWIIPDPKQAQAFVDFCYNVPSGTVILLPNGESYVTP